jgi:hypothetical protein
LKYVLRTEADRRKWKQTSPPQASQTDNSLQYDSIIISSVLGGFIILFITASAIAYCLYKRRKRQRELDYSPPFTSLAPPPRSALSPHTVRSSTAHEEPQETSLSMGPGVFNGTTHPPHPLQQHPQLSAPQQSRPADRDSTSQHSGSVPAITLQPSTPSKAVSTPTLPTDNRPGRQSQLYHDVLREETEHDAARRRRLEAPGLGHKNQRLSSGLSTLSDISDIDTGQLQVRPSGDHERRGRGVFPSTRASSGVFPHDD